MTRIVRAILIDPFACTVNHVVHDADDYRAIYTAISHESMQVDTFTCAYPRSGLDPGEAIFVDDEGLLPPKLHLGSRLFQFAGYPQPLAGKGLILGSDEEGESIGATSRVSAIRDQVYFLELLHGGFLKVTTSPWVREEV